jgi:5'-3' exonuclease
MANVYLIDGTYELFRAYFAVPPSKNRQGLEVGACRGLFSSLSGLLSSPSVTHVACAFDHVIESFRNDLFPGYKTSAGVPEDLLNQFELAERVTRALGIVTWPMLEFEADDALCTAARRYARDPGVDRVIICSPDKDLAQCVSESRIVCMDRRRDKILDEAGVIEKFGVPPRAIPDWLALVGDSADGIPGVPRWGAKTSALLLRHYGNIEAIPDLSESWTVKVRGAPALCDTLRRHRADVRLYKELATLRADVPLAENLPELEWSGPAEELLARLAIELDDATLSDRMLTVRERRVFRN